MSKKKFYVVWQGRHPGIYDDWEVCKKEIMGVKGAKYKGFPDRESAENAFREGSEKYWGTEMTVTPSINLSKVAEKPVSPAIAVDAACAGNPGKMEYQGVFVDFGVEPALKSDLFKSPVFPNGTNNIGEFLAIVHALALCWQKGLHQKTIYSDSYNAILWVKKRQCKTKLERTPETEKLYEIIARAENWLRTHDYRNPIVKWETDKWGEVPADFGRK